MSQLISKIDKLIKDGEQFQWENCSSAHSTGIGTFGDPSADWDIWVSRINKILEKTVKEGSEPYIYYKSADSTVIKGNFRDKFDLAKTNFVKALEAVKSLIIEGDIFNDLLVTSIQPKTRVKTSQASKKLTPASDNKIFIVHGHDHALKIELEIFLSHIGLKPIVLHREIDGGKTIIEKFEANSDVSYAFILLTPDEISYSTNQDNLDDVEREKEKRARPNVIFEFGYFIAKLGREKVCALHKGDVAIPSDLSGFIYKKVDSSVEEIGFSLIKELKAAGLKPRL